MIWEVDIKKRPFISLGADSDRLLVSVDCIAAIRLDIMTLYVYLRDGSTVWEYVVGDIEKAQTLYDSILTALEHTWSSE